MTCTLGGLVQLVPILINAFLVSLAAVLVYLFGVAYRGPFTRQQVWDGALVLLLIAIAQEEIWLPDYSFNNRVGPVGLAVASTTLIALLQLLRRREPLLVLTAAGFITVVRALLGGGVTGLGFLAPILVALYSVGRYERRVPWWLAAPAAAVVAIGSTALNTTLDPTHSTSAGFIAFTYLFMAVLWGLGRLLQSRDSANVILAEQAATLERERETRAREVVAQERARIARELHDVIAHNVSVIIVQAEAASALLSRQPEAARKPLERIESTGREAMGEMRRLVGILAGDDQLEVTAQPGLAQLPALVEGVRQAGLQVDFATEGDFSDLPGGLNLAAYRVIQEALTNVLKHAGATMVRVRVCLSQSALSMEVIDNGGRSGMVWSDSGGRGLIGMSQRIALYGGRLEAAPGGAGGFAVKALIPLEPGAA